MNPSEQLSPEDAHRVARLKSRADCIQFAENVALLRPDLATAAR